MASVSQNTTPWTPLQQPITDAVSAYGDLIKQPVQYFPGSTVAPQSANTQQGTSALAGAAQTQAGQAGQANQAFNFNLSSLLNPDSNPYLQAHATSAIKPVMDQLMQQILPMINRSAVTTGGYGGTAHANLKQNAINDAVTSGMDMTNAMYSNAYGQNLAAYMQTLGMTPEMMNMAATPARTQLQAGGIEDTYAQAKINEDVNRFNFEQTGQMDVLDRYLRTLFGSNYGQQTGTEQTDPSALDRILNVATLGLL